MLDLKFIRDNVELVKKGVKDKGFDCDIDKVLDLDNQRRNLLQEVEELKAKKNQTSSEIARLKGLDLDISSLLEKMKENAQKIKKIDETLAVCIGELEKESLWIPNLPCSVVPIGGEDQNKEIKQWGDKPTFDFELKAHWDIAEDLDIIDLKRGAKISGSGFVLFKGVGAKLERALINFMLDLHTQKHGYMEVATPFVVSSETMIGTGQLPKLEDDMYKVKDDDLYLIPTAEVPVTNIYRQEIVEQKNLPVSLVAYTPCFRREAGSYGKDTRGMIRIHQFDKVELVRFVHPDSSYDELEILLSHAETVLQKLNLHYRVSMLASADLSFAAAKCYDIEVWAPGQNDYLEVSSCSNFESFQARRMNIKFRCDGTKKLDLVHTLNGSGVALPRLVIALLETYQQPDGSVIVPEVLQPYLGCEVIKKL